MKKLLALLFVCAGLTAMAVTPNAADFKMKMGKADIQKAKVEAKAQVMNKAMNKDLSKFVAPALAPQNVLPQQHKANLNKRAPMRVTADDVYGDKMYFTNLYDWSQSMVIEDGDTSYVMSFTPSTDRYYYGGATRIYEDTYDGETEIYLSDLYYFSDIPVVFDYANQTATFAVGDGYNVTSEIIQIDTVTSGGGWSQRTYYDYYVYFVWLWPCDYLADEAELHDIVGELWDDGSIYFEDGMMYYFAEYYRRYNASTGSWSGSWSQVDGPWASDAMFETLITAPNGTHEYTNIDEETESNGVVMYQTNDTVVVWNLWDFGMPGNFMVLKSDYTMEFPAQYVFDFYESYPVVQDGDTTDIGGDFYNVYAELIDEQFTNFDMVNPGTVNESQIVWENCLVLNDNTWWDYYTYNKLNYTDGSTFVIPEPVIPDVVRGDVDCNGEVEIADVTALINALLTGNWEGRSPDNADCDLDGEPAIADVTTLIRYLLTGNWE